MCAYYLIVEIAYCDYINMKRGKAEIKHEFNTSQINLEDALVSCIRDFYSKITGCDIDNIAVKVNECFKGGKKHEQLL